MMTTLLNIKKGTVTRIVKRYSLEFKITRTTDERSILNDAIATCMKFIGVVR